jgi:hypothetical protein
LKIHFSVKYHNNPPEYTSQCAETANTRIVV